MKSVERPLNIFIFGTTLYSNEWSALLGDKYQSALSFPWAITDDVEHAEVIAWSGLMNSKSSVQLKKFESILKEKNRILILENEAKSLYASNPDTLSIDLHEIRFVALPSGGVLPEDLLAAIDNCHKKLTNV